MMVRKAKFLWFHSTLLHYMLEVVKTFKFEVGGCVLTLEFVCLLNKSWYSLFFMLP